MMHAMKRQWVAGGAGRMVRPGALCAALLVMCLAAGAQERVVPVTPAPPAETMTDGGRPVPPPASHPGEVPPPELESAKSAAASKNPAPGASLFDIIEKTRLESAKKLEEEAKKNPPAAAPAAGSAGATATPAAAVPGAAEAPAEPDFVFDGTDQDLGDVVRNFCDYLGYDYVMEPGINKMKVTFRSHNIGALSADFEDRREAVDRLFDAILYSLSLQKRLVGNVYHIEKRGNSFFTDEMTNIESGAENALTVQLVRLHYMNPANAANILKPLTNNSQGRLVSVPNLPILIIADSGANTKKYLEMLEVLDVDATDQRAYFLSFANAANVAQELKTIFGTKQNALGRSMDFVAITRLNAVVAYNIMSEDAPQIEEWIARLDQRPAFMFDGQAQDIGTVVDLFCEYLHFDYVLDKSVTKVQVTFRAKELQRLTGTEEEKTAKVRAVFDSLLNGCGLQMRLVNGIYHIERTGESYFGDGKDDVRVEVLQLQYLQPANAINLLKPLAKNTNGTFVAVPNQPIMIVADTPANVGRYLEVLTLLDVEPTLRKAYALQVANADDVTKELKGILGTRMGALGKPIEFFSIPRLNMVVAANMPEKDIAMVDQWVVTLDVNNKQEATVLETRVYRMQTEDAVTIAETLQKNFQAVAAKNEKLATLNKQKGILDTREADDIPSIVANESTNSLLIHTSVTNHKKIREILDELDREKKQVLIEVLIAEVTLTENTSLGVEWSLFQDSRDGKTVSGTQAKTLGEITSVTKPSNISNVSGAADLAKSGGSGLNYFVAESDKFMALLHASHTENRLDVLSSPNILTADGAEAEISIGEEVPVENTTTTDGTIQTGYDYKEAKIKLTVTPFINENQEVTMDVNQVIKQVQAATTQGAAPSFYTRELKTKLAVHSGQTVVIGGLIQKNNSNGNTQVPGIAKVPGLGRFFRSDAAQVKGTELLIVMTPRVVRSRSEVDTAVNHLRESIVGELKRSDLEKDAGLDVKPKPWWVRVSSDSAVIDHGNGKPAAGQTESAPAEQPDAKQKSR